jgi:hypothetical protein
MGLRTDKQDQLQGARIARLVLAGNTLTTPVRGEDDKKPVSRSLRDIAHCRNDSMRPSLSTRPILPKPSQSFSPISSLPGYRSTSSLVLVILRV